MQHTDHSPTPLPKPTAPDDLLVVYGPGAPPAFACACADPSAYRASPAEVARVFRPAPARRTTSTSTAPAVRVRWAA